MHAFAIDHFGEQGSLRLLPVPTPGPGEVLVRVHAAGVNPIDLKIRDGGKPVDVPLPHILGQDAAGVITRVGDGVTEYHEGDEVYGAFWLAGAFADYVNVTLSESVITPKPAGLDFGRAAALPTPGLAAVTAIRTLNPKRDESLLIVGATGGVGSYAVQLAARIGVRVLATARRLTEDYARSLGATELYDYTRGDLVALVREAHPSGIDAILDLVSDRDALTHMSTLLRSGGRLATTVHSADVAAMATRGIRASNLDVFGVSGRLDDLNGLIDREELQIPVQRSFPFSDTGEALTAIATGHTHGKIVLSIQA